MRLDLSIAAFRSSRKVMAHDVRGDASRLLHEPCLEHRKRTNRLGVRCSSPLAGLGMPRPAHTALHLCLLQPGSVLHDFLIRCSREPPARNFQRSVVAARQFPGCGQVQQELHSCSGTCASHCSPAAFGTILPALQSWCRHLLAGAHAQNRFGVLQHPPCWSAGRGSACRRPVRIDCTCSA